MHNSNGEQNTHQGENAAFWRDESVMKFDLQQSLVSEKNEDTLANITRITAYFAQVQGWLEAIRKAGLKKRIINKLVSI